jgi:hypothetical protein
MKTGKLNLYNDSQGNEHIAIIDNPKYADELNDDGYILVESITIQADFISWPTNRLFIQE